MAISHDAFISYSHSADRKLAPALERGLEKLAKPLLKLRALDVFRDETSLTASPALWPGIVEHLSGSQWFLLVASTASAASPWCNKEVLWWLENRSVDRMLLIVTDGEIAWDSSANDFDWNRTTVLSRSLCRRFAEEPLYVDMRWAREVESLSLSNPRFRNAVVDIAAPLRGMRKDELDSADVRQLRRNRLLVRAGVTAIVIAAAIAVWFAILADERRKEAERRRNEAIAGRLASDARDTQKEKHLDLALLLATASLRIEPTPQGANVLLSTFAPHQHPMAMLDAGNSVQALAATSDGRLLASGNANGMVTVWDLSTLQPFAGPYDFHGGPVNNLAFSPDNKLLAIAGRDSMLALWDVERRATFGEPLKRHDGEVRSVSFSPDGRLLASGGGDGSLLLWDLSQRTPVADLGGKEADGSWYEIYNVGFNPDGKLLASTSPNDGIRLWDVARRTQAGQPLTSDELRNPTRLAFSPDNTMLAVGDVSGSVVIWTLPDLEPHIFRGHDNQVWGLSFSRDSSMLASAGSFDGKVILRDVAGEGDPIGAPLAAHKGTVTSVAFLGNDKLATGGEDGKIIIWQVERHPAIARLVQKPVKWISSASFTADGKLLALGNEDSLFLWDLAHERQAGKSLKPDGMVSRLDFSRDGTTLISRSGNEIFTRWDLDQRKRIGEPFPLRKITASAVSPDGETLVSGNAHGAVVLWDLGSQAPLGQPLKHEGIIHAVAFSPDGRLAASGSEDGTVRLWDVARREPLGKPLKGHDGKVLCLSFSPEGELLASGGEDGVVVLWDVGDQSQTGVPLKLNGQSITSLAIAPDSKILAVGTSAGEITLWDIDSRTPMGPPLKGFSYSVERLAFNPADGKTLLSESEEGEVILWDVDPESWMERACRIANRNLTCREWRLYLRDVPYKPVCPDLQAPSCPDL